MADVTQILAAVEAGDPKAAGELLPLVCEELRKLAAARLANEKPRQALQPTTLFHEAYVRLVGPRRVWLVASGGRPPTEAMKVSLAYDRVNA